MNLFTPQKSFHCRHKAAAAAAGQQPPVGADDDDTMLGADDDDTMLGADDDEEHPPVVAAAAGIEVVSSRIFV